MADLGRSDWMQNLSEQKKQIVIGTLSVLAGVATLIVYFQSGPDPVKYAAAEAAFSEWKASPQDDLLYQSMQEAIRSVPAVQSKYEASIAQKLLDTNKINEALVLANRSFGRLEEEAPFHAAYAKTSLLIEQESFQKALENAVTLKEQMGGSFALEHKAGGLLYVYNLLRIACLQQELNNRPGEKAAWEELESSLQGEARLANILFASFTDRKINLTQYIAERKKAL